MSVGRTLKELISPGSVRRATLAPFEAGLSPDSALDLAEVVLSDDAEVDDIVVTGDGRIVCSVGSEVRRLDGPSLTTVASCDGTVTALAVRDRTILAAVEGTGVVAIDGDKIATSCDDDAVRTGVSALAVHRDGTTYATIASRHNRLADWSRGLLSSDSSGELVAISADGAVTRLTGDLGWPAGVCVTHDERLLVSESLATSITTLDRAGSSRATLATRLPFYPGRIRPSPAGYWLAAPYVRNRATELILSEPELVAEMTATIEPPEWMVPRLRSERPHTDALQIGQVRILGVIKPWAPPRSYGLVAHLDQDGRFDWSAHSRADGYHHGVTATGVLGDRLIVAARGRRNLLALPAPFLAFAPACGADPVKAS